MRTTGYYISHIVFGLITAQLLQNYYFSNYLIVGGLLLIVLHSFFIFNYLKDHFLFIIYLLSLSALYTNDKFGGIALAPFLIFINSIQDTETFKIKDKFVKINLLILIFTNFLGYVIKNPTELTEIVQSVIVFTGIILTFIFIQNFKLTNGHIKVIIQALAFIIILNFLVAINQRYVIINSSLPLLGSVRFPDVRSLNQVFYGRIPSLFADYELFAEFSLLMFIFSFTVIMDRKAIADLKLGLIPYGLLGFSFLNILLTGTRSCFILALVFVPVYFLFRFRAVFTKAAGRLMILMLILIPFLVLFGEKFGLDVIVDRLQEINVDNLSLKNLRSGEEMNRDLVYSAGYARLAQENWLLGYGFSCELGRYLAWFGGSYDISNQIVIQDFHSLYLCIPMIYGWIGAGAYFSLIVFIIISLVKKNMVFTDHPLGGITLGFTFVLIFFLIDQIKINSLRYYNYHFLIWILMGLALSVVNMKVESNEDTMVN